ncbi:hypothetical protein OG21DRAFT_1479713 [Imleria badia]|nr:hypothetical protein OG21DRAFT_1479713 [Imleria badia]
MVYHVPLIIFVDNVSGNISKQWNKHYQEFHVRFVTLSPHASPMELMHAMKEQAAESGVVAWDCRDEEEVLLIPDRLFHGGNNSMQAELCSQAGLSCNYFCHTCHGGGTKEYKGSNAGYCTLSRSEQWLLSNSGSLQAPDETVNEIKSQFLKALLSGATEKVKASVSSTGRGAGNAAMQESDVKKKLEDELVTLLNGHDLDEMINPLLGMTGVNIHLDTPTEILHTILLGIIKYFWGQTVFLIEKAKVLDLFHSCLDAIKHDALNIPSLNSDYICSYKGSLIGKHFKSLAQVVPFIIHDLVPQTVVDGWTLMGELVVLLWHTKINNIESYLVSSVRVQTTPILTTIGDADRPSFLG